MGLDHLRKLRKSMDDTSNYEEITKRYLEAQKKAFLFRNKHFQVLENVIKQFEKENLVLEEKIKSQKMKRPSTQKKDLRKEKDELSAKIKNLKKDVFFDFFVFVHHFIFANLICIICNIC